MRAGLPILAAVILAACGPTEQSPTVRISVDAAPAITRPVEPVAVQVVELSPEAIDKIEAIQAIIEANSLSRLSRLADSEASFVTNFAGERHRDHWDLLRRTGFDPLTQLGGLLEGPYGQRTAGNEVWFVWPDLAALSPEQLVPEKLSFTDRARLLELVGDPGITRIREGQGYPGIRTAIAEDGRWLYFVHEAEDEVERPNDG